MLYPLSYEGGTGAEATGGVRASWSGMWPDVRPHL